ncbi:hypothetical protein BB560_002559 [Smittium megazygosporum]|uniref:Cytochrome P450 n=1 Tax=Smittium megazygosporum TaxID=133381 RepID=A0A2T9ZEE7_9FUNG|nr:hypothetical protein BB560_002559 [Smittium megazygosporum]
MMINFSNNILSHRFSYEYLSHPQEALSQDYAFKILDNYVYAETSVLRYRKSLCMSFPFYMSNYTREISLTGSRELGISIDKYLGESESSIGAGVGKLDIVDFLSNVFDESSDRICFGKLSEGPEFRKLIYSYAEGIYQKPRPKIALLDTINLYFKKKRYFNLRSYLIENLSKAYSETSGLQPTDFGVNSLVDIYMHNSDVREFGKEGFVSVLMDVWFYIVKIIPTRLVNIVVDLSVEPNLYFILIQEQKDLIKKYGNDITYNVTKEMVFMDAFIKESLNNSTPASFIYRFIRKDIFLSNGTLLPKEQISSLNAFSKSVTNTSKSNRKFDISKHILHNKSFTEPSIDNLIWGYGIKACPFAEYAGMLIKIFTALLVRKLYIFSNIQGNQPVHPGYVNIFTIFPSESSVYFKKHDINHYRDLINLEEEYKNIMNSDEAGLCSE